MEIIKLSDKEYYNCDDLIKKDKEFFKNCELKIRNIIKWKKIPADKYIYGYKVDGNWKESNVKYNKSRLLLLKEYCDNNIKLLEEEEKIEEKQEEEIKKNNKIKKKEIVKEKKIKKINKVIEEIQEENKNKNEVEILEKLPPLIELKDDEKFKDENNLPLDIEVRGIREYDKIYFNVEDVMIAFNMPNLNITLTDKRKDYIKNIHYKKFYRIAQGLTKKNIFLTYLGFVRVLFVSHNKNCEKFQEWAIKILYTHQMGTPEQKQELAKNLLNSVPYLEVKKSIKTFVNKISCVYLILLGQVKDLRTSMEVDKKYSDDSYIFKLGYAEDFEKRMAGHKQTFKDIKNVKLALQHLAPIDKQYISQAETDLKKLTNRYKFNYKNFDELIILTKEEVNEVKEIYSLLCYKYSGSDEELKERTKKLEETIKENQNKKEVEILQKELELKEKDNIINMQKKELELKDRDLELKDKDIEILRKELYIKKLELEIANK
jgi:hypothetical protein